MSTESITLAIIDALDAAQIPYAIVGSLSSNEWGIPRSTHDADILINLGSTSVLRLRDHLPSTFHLDPQMQFEGITGTYRNVITINGSPFKIELFRLTDDPHDQSRFQRRVQVTVSGRTTWVPTAEDVIITKVRWIDRAARGKDRDDVAGIIAVQGDKLDWDYIHRWCDEHGTRPVVEEIRSLISPAG